MKRSQTAPSIRTEASKNRFSLTSIRGRFILTLFGIVTAIVLLLWISINLYFKEYVAGQKILSKRHEMDSYLAEIESQLNSVESLAGTVCYDRNIQRLVLRFQNRKGYEKYAAAGDIENAMNYLSIMRSDILISMFVRDRNGNNCFLDTAYYSDIPMFNGKWTDAGNGMQYSPVFYLQQTNRMQDAAVLQFRYPFKDLGSPTVPLGELIMNLNAKRIFPLLEKGSDGEESFVIVGRDSLYSTGMTDFDMPSFDELLASPVLETGDYIFLSGFLNRLDCLIVNIFPVRSVVSYVNDVNRIIVYISIFGLLLAALMSFIFSNLLTRPVSELNIAMAKVTGGDLAVRLRKLPGDEFGGISTGMNLMLDEISFLLDKVDLAHKKERETELRLFVAQINPHFLYNTLNSIIYLSRAGKNEDTISLTRAFIYILRRNIHLSNSPVSLHDEVDYLSNYMSIMKYRYGNMIGIDFDISAAMMDKYIYPMLLYPLVENSIYHGITPKGQAGKITLRVIDEGETVLFQVIDDGIGISREKIGEIEADIAKLKDETPTSIGIANVQNRLWAYYSPASTLKIESVPTKGTQVSFKINKTVMDLPDCSVISEKVSST